MSGYVFHLDSQQTRLVVTGESGNRVEDAELNSLCERLNGGLGDMEHWKQVLAGRMVCQPGHDGSPDVGPQTPEEVIAFVDGLQEEWDDAESRLADTKLRLEFVINQLPDEAREDVIERMQQVRAVNTPADLQKLKTPMPPQGSDGEKTIVAVLASAAMFGTTLDLEPWLSTNGLGHVNSSELSEIMTIRQCQSCGVWRDKRCEE